VGAGVRPSACRVKGASVGSMGRAAEDDKESGEARDGRRVVVATVGALAAERWGEVKVIRGDTVVAVAVVAVVVVVRAVCGVGAAEGV
jgi:hypothetical protein